MDIITDREKEWRKRRFQQLWTRFGFWCQKGSSECFTNLISDFHKQPSLCFIKNVLKNEKHPIAHKNATKCHLWQVVPWRTFIAAPNLILIRREEWTPASHRRIHFTLSPKLWWRNVWIWRNGTIHIIKWWICSDCVMFHQYKRASEERLQYVVEPLPSRMRAKYVYSLMTAIIYWITAVNVLINVMICHVHIEIFPFCHVDGKYQVVLTVKKKKGFEPWLWWSIVFRCVLT